MYNEISDYNILTRHRVLRSPNVNYIKPICNSIKYFTYDVYELHDISKDGINLHLKIYIICDLSSLSSIIEVPTYIITYM